MKSRINRNRIDKWNRKLRGNLLVTRETVRQELRKSTKQLVQRFAAQRVIA